MSKHSFFFLYRIGLICCVRTTHMTICVHCIHTCYPLRRNCVFSNDFLSFDVENEKVVSNLKRSHTHIPKQIKCIIEKKDE